jgi:hypothetical protein
MGTNNNICKGPPNDLYIVDSNFDAASKNIADYANELLSVIYEYKVNLRFVCETVIQDELIRSKLVDIIEKLNPIEKEIKETVDKITSNCSAYVKRIDEADQYLYD